jgi:putative ABC transport system permease protein
MFKNYMKIAMRNLTKNKTSSFINIGGLAVGMAVAMLIGLWIWDELSYNKHYNNYNDIGLVMYRETRDGETSVSNTTPIPMGYELQSTYKDNFRYVVISTQTGGRIISAGDKKFIQQGNYMQPDAPDMFTLKMLYGSRRGLSNPNSILLNESLAKKLFGDVDPVNKVVTIDNKTNVTVTGVYKDIPKNAELNSVTFIAPWDLFVATSAWIKDVKIPWRNNFLRTYVQLSPGTDFEKASAAIKDVKLRNVSGEVAARKPAVFVQPMSKWRLYSTFEHGLPVTSDGMKYIRLYGVIGLFVLLLACINFMNLSTARSEKRAREVGVRKAMGSSRQQLIRQFYSESLLIAFCAFILSLALVQLILPWFNGVAGKKITVSWINAWFWLGGIAFTLITGLLAGSYPALYLSSFNPVKVLKGVFRVGRLATMPRKVLVVTQFTISVALIIGTLIIYRQVQHARQRPVGYSRDGLITFNKSSREFGEKFDVLRNELYKTGTVSSIAESGGEVTNIWSNNGGFDWRGKDPGMVAYFGTMSISAEFGKTVGWQMAQGRDFSKDMASDSTGLILNEAAVKLMGLKTPVGETVHWTTDFYKDGDFHVIGVVKDMLMESPFEPTQPSVFFLRGGKGTVHVRLNPRSSTSDALAKIEAVFKKILPAVPFDYKFIDEEYAKKFAAEERIGKLVSFFASLAIFISCLGLFGLASFVAEQRTKEIGVRKVLGASVFNIWQLLSKEFVLLVLLACVIAIPVAIYLMNSWLEKYQYRIEISWWMAAATGMGALIITLLTVSYQSIKAALMNPTKSLRSE